MRVLAIAASLVVGLVGFLMVMAFWFDTTAVTVKFVNDTKLYVALPDCSTDIAEIAAGSTAPSGCLGHSERMPYRRCHAWHHCRVHNVAEGDPPEFGSPLVVQASV